VESYPEDTEGRPVSQSFLHDRTVPMFERHGFERDHRIGKHRWVLTKFVPRSVDAAGCVRPSTPVT
jgi:hypothetical protein